MATETAYGISDLLLLLTALHGLIFLYIYRKCQYWKNRGINYPTFRHCIKQIFDVTKKPTHEISVDNYRKFGKIHGNFSGFRPQLSVGDPVLVKHILVKDFHAFQNRVSVTLGSPVLDKMLSILNNEDWKRVRCIMTPGFTTVRMRKTASILKEHAENFAKFCEKIAENNEEVNCKLFYAIVTADIIASVVYGVKINALDYPDHPFLRNSLALSSSDSLPFYLTLMLFPSLLNFLNADMFLGDALNYFKRFTEQVIAERKKNKINMNDLLHLLMEAHGSELQQIKDDIKESVENERHLLLPQHKKMTFDELVGQCLSFILAGGESTSTTLTFLTHYLALYTECQEKLIEEIDRTLDTYGEVNYDILNKMPYLDAVVSEVLRIEPIAIQLVRTAVEDYELGSTGIIVEKGMQVVVPIYAMHRDPEFFPDPDKFIPERFLPENRESIHPFTYLPFGDGRRNCIGLRFGILAIKLCIFYVLRSVRFEATENTKKPLEFFKGHSLLNPKNTMVKITKRNDVRM